MKKNWANMLEKLKMSDMNVESKMLKMLENSKKGNSWYAWKVGGKRTETIHSETQKQHLKKVLEYTLHLLAKKGLITSESFEVVTEEHN